MSTLTDHTYCRSCGTDLPDDTDVCPECGVNVRTDDVGTPTAYCRTCGEEIKAAAEICPHCGVRQRSPPGSATADLSAFVAENRAIVAAAASFFLPGLGQLVNEEVGKGIVVFVAFLAATFSLVVLVGFLAVPVVWAYGVYDAYVTGKRLQEEYRATY
ncbi:zinc ribbon domain-containing protein [Halomarina ordinaria]|uniref:Zinc ribbon domain-containing protein n=1 Tax=Halomarina ordinaria TaxID=3033939 RepID=A0ABD5U578_9EURY|nr:zinc ribbon domain-containing protein [Halomarina sp. PSRA2]